MNIMIPLHGKMNFQKQLKIIRQLVIALIVVMLMVIAGNILNTLSEREAEVLRLRFGIGVPKAMTLEEVGQHFGVTRERIRQIEDKAIRKLRHPMRARMLKEAMTA